MYAVYALAWVDYDEDWRFSVNQKVFICVDYKSISGKFVTVYKEGDRFKKLSAFLQNVYIIYDILIS